MLLSQRQSAPVHGKAGVKPVFKVDVPGRVPVEWGDTTYRKLLYRIAYDTHGDETDSVSITQKRVLDAIAATRLMRQVEEKNQRDLASEFIDPNVAKVGGLQSQGGRCEAVVIYCERLPTQDLESSGFPPDNIRWG